MEPAAWLSPSLYRRYQPGLPGHSLCPECAFFFRRNDMLRPRGWLVFSNRHPRRYYETSEAGAQARPDGAAQHRYAALHWRALRITSRTSSACRRRTRSPACRMFAGVGWSRVLPVPHASGLVIIAAGRRPVVQCGCKMMVMRPTGGRGPRPNSRSMSGSTSRPAPSARHHVR
jgi:hypothetical protein